MPAGRTISGKYERYTVWLFIDGVMTLDCLAVILSASHPQSLKCTIMYIVLKSGSFKVHPYICIVQIFKIAYILLSIFAYIVSLDLSSSCVNFSFSNPTPNLTLCKSIFYDCVLFLDRSYPNCNQGQGNLRLLDLQSVETIHSFYEEICRDEL